MIRAIAVLCKRLTAAFAPWLPPDPVTWRSRLTLAEALDPATAVPAFVAHCPLATRMRTLLHPLDWHACPERPRLRPRTATPYPGPTPEARAPYLFFFLCAIAAGYLSHAKLARFLREHPSLLWLAGIRLTPDPSTPWGFDPLRTAPNDDRLRAVLRDLDPAPLQWLLSASVQCFRQVPAFGHSVVGDTKHILAWVKANNPKCFVPNRYDPQQQPTGDRDCRLGVKKRRNATPTIAALPASDTPHTVAESLYWGYASGVVATSLAPGLGEVVLAEETRPFDQSDIAYFPTLMAQTERALGFAPPNGAWDAAFDAFYVYDYFDRAGGMAAVPLNLHGHSLPRFTPDGTPLCATDHPMHARFTFKDRSGLVHQHKTRFVCPLLHPTPTGASCDHPMFAKGGCTANRGTSRGALLRYTLDRDSSAYRALYRQRSAVERVNAAALDLGIERPHLRNLRSIRNRNTLIYILLNLHTFQRLKARHPDWCPAP